VNTIKRQSLIRQQWWIQRKLMNVGVRLLDSMQVRHTLHCTASKGACRGVEGGEEY
jgi:hypothetical protein